MLLVEELVMERRSTSISFLTLTIHMVAISHMIENNAKSGPTGNDRRQIAAEWPQRGDRRSVGYAPKKDVPPAKCRTQNLPLRNLGIDGF
ncbi:hypothetical protein [Sphingobium yanoikuyae]